MAAAVAFDLDMTLVDSRRGIALSLLALEQQFGRKIDAGRFVSSLGPPIPVALSPWFSAAELPAAVTVFRQNMAEIGVVNVTAMPGAAAAIDAARSAGFEIVVITTKVRTNAQLTLKNSGLDVDHIIGDAWTDSRTDPLTSTGAACFVGDQATDMQAAVAAGIPGFGVTTGSSTERELRDAGAQYVAASLTEFPDWLPTLGS